MSQYPLIVATLREFDLITEEQKTAAMADWERVMDEIHERKMQFREEWIARRNAKPWWRRLGPFYETEWLADWYRQEDHTS